MTALTAFEQDIFALCHDPSILRGSENYLDKFIEPDEENSIILRKEKEIESLQQIYDIENMTLIRSFLLDNDFLIETLFGARNQIDLIFGPEINLVLEMDVDPEEGSEELFIVIKTSLSTKLARNLLNKLVNNWFVDIMDKVNNKLNITEETI
jgi:hypothetical protein